MCVSFFHLDVFRRRDVRLHSHGSITLTSTHQRTAHAAAARRPAAGARRASQGHRQATGLRAQGGRGRARENRDVWGLWLVALILRVRRVSRRASQTVSQVQLQLQGPSENERAAQHRSTPAGRRRGGAGGARRGGEPRRSEDACIEPCMCSQPYSQYRTRSILPISSWFLSLVLCSRVFELGVSVRSVRCADFATHAMAHS